MPENAGHYQKYNVSRVDGKPIATDENGVTETFTLEFTKDPFAAAALRAYQHELLGEQEDYSELITALDDMIARCP